MTTSKIIRSAAAIVLAAMMITSCASEYDDSALKSSLSRLEQQTAALQSALNAVERNLHILSVKETDGAFFMTFSDGSTVTVQKPDGTEDVEPTAEYISEIAVENGVVVFHLSDGRSFSIPVKTTFTFSLDVDSTMPIKPGQTITVGWKAETSIDGDVELEAMAQGDISVEVTYNKDRKSGKLIIKAGYSLTGNEKVIVIATDGSSVKICSLLFESDGIVLSDSPRVTVSSDGGNVELCYLSNIKCNVTVEESAKSWIKVVQTKTMSEHSAIINVARNDGKERSAKVTISNQDGSLSATYTVVQQENPASSNMIDGNWYLHFVTIGRSIYVYPSSEYLSFNGLVMEWRGRSSEPDEIYDVEYNSDYTSFKIKGRNNPADIQEHVIVKKTEKLLVVKHNGSTRYFYPSEYEANNASENDLIMEDLKDPEHAETSDINVLKRYSYGHTHSDVNPMGIHFLNAHVTSDSDRAWLADATKNPSGINDMNQWRQKKVVLYPFGDPVPADCNQHSIGDCSAIAVFAEMSYLFPGFIKSIITDNGNDTYTVKMFDPQGKPVDVSVNNYFLMDNGGYIAQCTGKNEIPSWATIMEKAMMKWEEIYQVDNVWGIGSEFAAPLFTGDGDSFAFATNSIYPSESLTILKWALGEGMICIGGFDTANLMCDELPSVTYHAFSMMLTRKSDFLFSMRNPWGNGGQLDGVLNIPNDRRYTYSIDMRLIGAGAAKPYLVKNLGPYIPPTFNASMMSCRVSDRLRVTGE